MQAYLQQLENYVDQVMTWLLTYVFSVDTAIQAGAVVAVAIIAWVVQKPLHNITERLKYQKSPIVRLPALALRSLLLPLSLTIFLHLGATVFQNMNYAHSLLDILATLSLAWVVIRLLSGAVQNADLQHFISIAVFVVAALHIVDWLSPVITFLDSLRFETENVRISLLDILKTALTIIVLFWLAKLIGHFLEHYFNSMKQISPSGRVLLGKVTHIGLYTVAFAVALSVAGINLTTLAVFSGAVGVGIGFGLQKVVSNFISGLIILLDRSIKPGDIIELSDGHYGWINRLSGRYVSVTTRDGEEHLIPNEDFITERVINLSYADKNMRLKINVGVSYKTDLRKAMNLMLEAALENDRVLRDPEPKVWITEFADSAVNLQLRIWIADPESGSMNVRGDIMLRVWDAFAKKGIEIPFPQMDIHLPKTEAVKVRKQTKKSPKKAAKPAKTKKAVKKKK